ncbi:hypothetical protein ACFWVC_32180 [Streptomyces sp. NPDC058691]|uniref:hypothetical protein n=1 Tax=Streptomyces sp. NPDC058691 TaxID=3346601 RepID=UPI003662ECA2
MRLRTSAELMTWQPPMGWRDLSYQQRAQYLQRIGLEIPLRTSDWGAMDWDQQARYMAWHRRIWNDTPEERAYKWGEYRKELRAWWILMGWWCLCLGVGLGLIWGKGLTHASVAVLVVITVIVVAVYTVSIFLFMFLSKPVPPHSS